MPTRKAPPQRGGTTTRAQGSSESESAARNPHLGALILVLGLLALVALLGVIWLTATKDNPSAQALVAIVTTIVVALTNLLIQNQRQHRA